MDDPTSLPLTPSKIVNCSSSLPATFECKKTLPPATTGEECPSPTVARQSTFGGADHGLMISLVVPSRFGPSHCGQSPAESALAQTSVNANATDRIEFT